MGNIMQDKRKENAAEIVVDGQAYKFSVLNTEQQYLVRQMHSCSTKMNNLKFELDQANTAFQGFEKRLKQSIRSKTKKEMG